MKSWSRLISIHFQGIASLSSETNPLLAYPGFKVSCGAKVIIFHFSFLVLLDSQSQATLSKDDFTSLTDDGF